MRVVLFGAGETGRKAFKKIKSESYFSDEIIAFVDNNQLLWGKQVDGLKVISLHDAEGLAPDCYIICSIYHKAIIQQLEMQNVPLNKVCDFNTYKCRCYVRWKYNKRYAERISEDQTDIEFDCEERIVVYTSITGSYDDLHEPSFLKNNIDYVCFTNNRSIKSDVWNIEYVNDDCLSDVLLAKKYKLHPERYFTDYRISVWLDGKFEVRGDLSSYISKYLKKEPMLCFPHYERNCIYDEAAACLMRGVGIKADIIKQISTYYLEGFPFDYGLYEMGCIVRKHMDNRVINLMNMWEDEINRFSYRDQLSFPYVCKKMGFQPDICDIYMNNNEYFAFIPHN